MAAEVERRAGPPATVSDGKATHHCPHPDHADASPSFTVKDGRWCCWSACARGGDVIDLRVWLDGKSKAEVIADLAAEAGIDRPTPVRQSGSNDRARLVSWCGGRGWGPWIVDELGLSVVTDGYGRPRVRFPFRLDGKVPYHQDRALSDKVRVRWLSPTGGRPIPYEADRLAVARKRDHVVVVEGVTDVAALVDVYTNPAAVGIPGVGAWRSSWAAAFAGLGVVVVADNDDAGARFRAKLGEDLAGVARAVWQVYVPQEHNDLAAWLRAVGPDHFDDHFMAAVLAADGAEMTP